MKSENLSSLFQKISPYCLAILAGAAFSLPVHATVSTGPGGEGVTVGQSSLITTVQLSDSFTFSPAGTSNGTRNGIAYTAGSFPLSGNSTNNAKMSEIESAFLLSAAPSPSNEFLPISTGSLSAFSLDDDSTHYTGATPVGNAYPGASGAGSLSGFTQTGITTGTNKEAVWGIAYGQSNNFMVQVDAVQLPGRVEINIGQTVVSSGGSSPNYAADGLSVFFNGGGTVGLFNTGVNGGVQTLTSISDSLATDKWNNYAVQFNLTAKTLSIYGNELLLNTINLATFDGGAYAANLNSSSDAFVGVGGAETVSSGVGILFTDNFEVGLTPEPSTLAMIFGGLCLLVLAARYRRLV